MLPSAFAYGAFTSYGRLSQNLSASFSLAFCGSITPRDFSLGLGSSDFARRYFRNRSFFLFLALLRWFSSGGSLCMTMDSSCSDGGSLRRVSPFRDPRITGYVLLPVAYRSLSRLSSALSAKAFTLCSLSLDHFVLVLTSAFPLAYGTRGLISSHCLFLKRVLFDEIDFYSCFLLIRPVCLTHPSRIFV